MTALAGEGVDAMQLRCEEGLRRYFALRNDEGGTSSVMSPSRRAARRYCDAIRYMRNLTDRDRTWDDVMQNRYVAWTVMRDEKLAERKRRLEAQRVAIDAKYNDIPWTCAATTAHRASGDEWDGYCKHGVYVGGCGVDYMCGRCEMGDDAYYEEDGDATDPF